MNNYSLKFKSEEKSKKTEEQEEMKSGRGYRDNYRGNKGN